MIYVLQFKSNIGNGSYLPRWGGVETTPKQHPATAAFTTERKKWKKKGFAKVFEQREETCIWHGNL